MTLKPITIDSHVHVFPDKLGNYLKTTSAAPVVEQIALFRRKGRGGLKKLQHGLHAVQPWLRHLPVGLRKQIDSLTYMPVLSHLLLESTAEDLQEAMTQEKIDYSVIIASPPHASNEYVLELAKEFQNLIPVVNIPPGHPGSLLDYSQAGARALKIHAAFDGAGPDSEHYLKLLQTAEELELPVILHTGCIHVKLLYKDPHQGHAERFEPWFKKFNRVQFILAHMNLNEPEVALNLCERYPNLKVDTSWQPAKMIQNAVRRLGADRVMLGSDWPLLGDNIAVSLNRLKECVNQGMISSEEYDLVRGGNAAQVFKIAVGN